MKHPLIAELIAALEETYGGSYLPYGTSEQEENGTGFRIVGIEATFQWYACTIHPRGSLMFK